VHRGTRCARSRWRSSSELAAHAGSALTIVSTSFSAPVRYPSRSSAT
jgi:hypothetical protein